MLDDFREWLSDNLRYFMLGGAILLVILVLFFGIRACSRVRRGNSGNEGEVQSQEDDSESGQDSADGEGDTPEEVQTDPSDVTLEKNNADITALMEDYYAALGEKDITALRTLVKDLSPSDEARINNSKDYIEKYELGDVYSQKGLTADSYVVYACNDYIFSGIDTPVPALSKLYVIKDSDGKWKVDGAAWEDSEISAYARELEKNEDVAKLAEDVKTRNEAAQASDSRLAEFLEGLGDEVIVPLGSDSETSETVMKVLKECNVRAEPSTDAEVVTILEPGTEVKALSTEGEWVKVEYEGKTAYIFAELLE